MRSRGNDRRSDLPPAAGYVAQLSTLDVAGRSADSIAELFWWMAGVGAAIWLAVTLLALYASSRTRPLASTRFGNRLIIAGGVVLPSVLLAVLLAFALPSLPPSVRAAGEGRVIHVSGEQWWWRVRYTAADGTPVDLANELRLPVGEPTLVRLSSDNVIHSFWIPSLAGKLDMIPGRVTQLLLEPTRTGVFGGVCAEYCGTSHARMAFTAVVTSTAAFDRWVATQAEPARDPTNPQSIRGRDLFAANGCGACHTIRGTPARGVIGPDLTHIASRHTVGGVVMNDAAALAHWIAQPDRTKPGVQMPSFVMLGETDIQAIAAYLADLR